MVIKIEIPTSHTEDGPTCVQNFKLYFAEYCRTTSIHGLQFLGEKGRTWIEKIFWLILLSTSLYFCITLILQIYHKWDTSPVIVTFATNQTPIWKIPFPSVTICPQIKSDVNKYNFTDNLLKMINNNTNESEIEDEFRIMQLICPTFFSLMEHTQTDVYDITNASAIDFLIQVAPDFTTMLFRATWLGENLLNSNEKREKIFAPVLTNEGICYSFNLLDPNEILSEIVRTYDNFDLIDQDPSLWTIEHGYDGNAGLNAFPRRTILSGMKGGLDLMLSTKSENIDPMCTDSVHGYKIIVSYPAVLPKSDENYFRVPLDQDVVAAVQPNMMTTSEDLRHYSPENRQCYFIEERKLTFFKIYNQQNCMFECLTNYTNYYCGCVGFYMPRDNSTSICGSEMRDCLLQAETFYLDEEVSSKIHKDKKGLENSGREERFLSPEDCNCLPSCNAIEFDIETSQSDWDWKLPISTLTGVQDLNQIHFSRLRIFFKDMQFITSERNQLYGQTDFWANCGGLLGLFTGFSFISLIEIFYFMSLRLICNIRIFGKKYWSGESELLEARAN